MAAPKGHPRYGGRKKGSKNRDLQEIREAMKDLFDNHLDDMGDWLNRIAENDPDKAFSLMLSLAKYCVPTLAAVQITGDNGQQMLMQLMIGDEDKKKLIDNI